VIVAGEVALDGGRPTASIPLSALAQGRSEAMAVSLRRRNATCLLSLSPRFRSRRRLP